MLHAEYAIVQIMACEARGGPEVYGYIRRTTRETRKTSRLDGLAHFLCKGNHPLRKLQLTHTLWYLEQWRVLAPCFCVSPDERRIELLATFSSV